jgi:hypothetical protein
MNRDVITIDPNVTLRDAEFFAARRIGGTGWPWPSAC